MALTDRQRLLLVSDLRTWINIAASVSRHIIEEPEELHEIVRDSKGSFNPDPKQVAIILRVAVVNVHTLAIALRQIDRHVQLLTPEWSGELASRGAKFRTLFASSEMQDFRDVLEHSADYVADRGRKPELKQSEQAGYSVLGVDKRISGISVFGKTYDVLPVIAAALDLMPLLSRTTERDGSSRT